LVATSSYDGVKAVIMRYKETNRYRKHLGRIRKKIEEVLKRRMKKRERGVKQNVNENSLLKYKEIGRTIKWRYLREFISKEGAGMICLQEKSEGMQMRMREIRIIWYISHIIRHTCDMGFLITIGKTREVTSRL